MPTTRRHRPWLAALLLLALGLARTATGKAEPPPSANDRASTARVFASEDTIPIPVTLLPVTTVTAPRVTLDEILRRVADGESRRDSLMHDQSFTMLAAITYVEPRKGAAAATTRQWESASKVYRQRPDKVRTIPLRHMSKFRDDDGDNVQVGADMGENLVNFAFQARTRSRFSFRILERHLVGDHVIYLVGFTPRSKLDDLPTGRAWIDTQEFVIVRQEFWYRERSPAPLIFERIDSCVIERTRVDGRWWVMSRLLARVQFTSLARFLARVGKEKLSPTVDFTLSMRDWRVNEGIDEAVFTTGGKP